MRRNLKIFVFLFVFFVVVAFGSILFLDDVNSVFYKTRDSQGATTAVMTQTVIGEESKDINVDTVPIVETSKTKEETTVVSEPEPEPEPKPEPEPVVEQEVVEAAPSIRYFKYTTDTTRSVLRLREEPSTDAKILAKLAKKSTGYIVKPGNTWCKVVTASGKEGYVSTEYLVIDEVQKEEFPDDIVDKVEAADEELSAKFNS